MLFSIILITGFTRCSIEKYPLLWVRRLIFMVATALQLALKVKTDTKLFNFLEWYETHFQTTNPETGRKRKGNAKKFITEELEFLLTSGKSSPNLAKVVDEFRQSSLLSPELQLAKQNLSDAEFAKFVELMEKAKSGN